MILFSGATSYTVSRNFAACRMTFAYIPLIECATDGLILIVCHKHPSQMLAKYTFFSPLQLSFDTIFVI